MAKAEPKGTIMTRANAVVSNAIKHGKMIRPTKCESCGDEYEHQSGSKAYIHAHHDDYRNPLDVRWLCGSCHIRWHVINGPGIGFDFTSMVSRIENRKDLSDFPPSYVMALKQQVIETGTFCAGLVSKKASRILVKEFSANCSS